MKKRNPLRILFPQFEHWIVLVYIALGSLWILFSDRILNHFVTDSTLVAKIQTYKGWFYVLATALLFYLFLKKHLRKLRDAEEALLHNNDELRKTKEKAEASDRLKTIFLQNISHELRTPMNGIIGFSQMLLKSRLSDEKRDKYLQIIIDSSNQLLRIISDIVDISKIEAGVIQVYKQKFDLHSVLNTIHEILQPQMELSGNKLSKKFASTQKVFPIVADEEKIRQVMTNLLVNAAKFTSDGTVEYGYKVADKDIIFFVEDTGVGILPEFQPKIFDRFIKGINHTTTTAGTGLGLPICKGLVESMGGKIWFTSTPGKGSRFSFTVPWIHSVN